jgi:hypothetical protein
LDLSEWGRDIYDPNSTCGNPAGCTDADSTTAGVNPSVPYPTGTILAEGERLLMGWDDPSYVAGSNQFQTTTPGLSDYANDTSVAYMHKMFPAPTNAAYTSNYTANGSSGGNNYQLVSHIDHDITGHNHLSGRYTWWDNINRASAKKSTACTASSSTTRRRYRRR